MRLFLGRVVDISFAHHTCALITSCHCVDKIWYSCFFVLLSSSHNLLVVEAKRVEPFRADEAVLPVLVAESNELLREIPMLLTHPEDANFVFVTSTHGLLLLETASRGDYGVVCRGRGCIVVWVTRDLLRRSGTVRRVTSASPSSPSLHRSRSWLSRRTR